eukprot:52786-Eustigmatos_ZCMA.PRE.1
MHLITTLDTCVHAYSATSSVARQIAIWAAGSKQHPSDISRGGTQRSRPLSQLYQSLYPVLCAMNGATI